MNRFPGSCSSRGPLLETRKHRRWPVVAYHMDGTTATHSLLAGAPPHTAGQPHNAGQGTCGRWW